MLRVETPAVTLLLLCSTNLRAQALPFDTTGARRGVILSRLDSSYERHLGGDTIVRLQIMEFPTGASQGNERRPVLHFSILGRDTSQRMFTLRTIPLATCRYRAALARDSGASRIVWRSERVRPRTRCPFDRVDLPGREGAADLPIETVLGDSLPEGTYFLRPTILLADGRTLPYGTIAVRLTNDTTPPSRDLSTLRFASGAAVAGQAPRELRAWTRITNVGRRPVRFDHGSCSLELRLWRDSLRRGSPIFRSEFRAPLVRPEDRPVGYACTSIGLSKTLWPRDTTTFRIHVPVAEILADSLPSGRYWARVDLKLTNRERRSPYRDTTYSFPVGSVALDRAPDPWPSVRVVDDIRYQAATRIVRDSVRSFVLITNVGSRPRRLDFHTANPLSISAFRPGALLEAPWVLYGSTFSLGEGRMEGGGSIVLKAGEKWLFERSESARELAARHGAGEYDLLASVFGRPRVVSLSAGKVRISP